MPSMSVHAREAHGPRPVDLGEGAGVELTVHEPTAAAAPDTPRAEDQRRRAARQEALAWRAGRVSLFGTARLVAFVAGLVLAVLAFYLQVLSAWWLTVPAVLFVVAFLLHERVLRASRAAERAVAYYDRALERLDDRWSGTGQPGTRYRDEQHPNAAHPHLFRTR